MLQMPNENRKKLFPNSSIVLAIKKKGLAIAFVFIILYVADTRHTIRHQVDWSSQAIDIYVREWAYKCNQIGWKSIESRVIKSTNIKPFGFCRPTFCVLGESITITLVRPIDEWIKDKHKRPQFNLSANVCVFFFHSGLHSFLSLEQFGTPFVFWQCEPRSFPSFETIGLCFVLSRCLIIIRDKDVLAH